MLLADYGRRELLPRGSFDGFQPPKPTIPKSVGHHQEWIQAAKGDPTSTLCNFDYSGRLIAHNLLGAVAHRTGKKIEWDAEAMRATNAPEAAKFVRKKYPKGWADIFEG